MLQPIIFVIFLFLSGCGGVPVGLSVLANTGGTIAGNAIWNEIKKYQDNTDNKVVMQKSVPLDIRKRADKLHGDLYESIEVRR